MKIVLNKCYGGFSLSHEAQMRVFEKRGVKVFPYFSKWEDGDTFYKKYDSEKQKKSSLLDFVVYFKEDPQVDSFCIKESEKDKYDSIYLEFDHDRTNKELIDVVEEMGEKANGRYAYLKVFEIPDGASYEISDYDGIETAHYGFQTGSV